MMQSEACGPGAGGAGAGAAAHERHAQGEGPAVKAEVPAHAQRMSSLLALDKAFAACRVERRAYDVGRGVGRARGGRAWDGGSA